MGRPLTGRPTGRPRKHDEKRGLDRTRSILEVIRQASMDAIWYLEEVAQGEVRAEWARINVCQYLIDQQIGKPKQRTEITGAGGAPLTWQALVLLVKAEEAKELPPVDVGEIIEAGEFPEAKFLKELRELEAVQPNATKQNQNERS